MHSSNFSDKPARSRSPFGFLPPLLCLAICVLAGLAGLQTSSAAGSTDLLLPLAQGESPFDANPGFGGGGGVGWNTWYIEAFLVAVSFLFLAIFCFFVIYQLLLRNFWWPSTAYGFTAALVLTLTVVVASFLFWEDLHGTGLFRDRWWKPGLLWLITSMISILLCMLFKSSRGRATAR
jgi:hypothetical protein